jgi:hypothetical protein
VANLYSQLFGKEKPTDGSVIDFAEHGRVGGLSTNQGVKYVQMLDSSGAVISSLGNISLSLASLSIAGQATVTAIQGDAGTQAWLVTLATLSVVGNFSGGSALATVTSIQGDSGTKPWLATLATLPVVAQNIDVLLSTRLASGSTLPVTGTLGALNAGGSLTAYQGGTWAISSLPTLSVFQGTTPWQATTPTLLLLLVIYQY